MSRVATLSARQREILRLIARHMQAKEVARALHISEWTVRTHTEEARKRLGVASTREAARVLIEYEVLEALPRDEGPSPQGLAASEPDVSALGHEQALRTEIPAHPAIDDRPVDRAIQRLVDAGSPRQGGLHPGDPGYGEAVRPGRPDQESRLHHGGGNGVADGRWARLEKRLGSLSFSRWLGLIAATGLIVVLIVIGMIMTTSTVLYVVQHIMSRVGH